MDLNQKFNTLCNESCDINEHLPTLSEYSKKCESVLELGVRTGVSTFAFIHGLTNNSSTKRRLVSCDINGIGNASVEEMIDRFCKENNIEYTFLLKNDLDITNEEVSNVDITFIDTWHIYGQLKRELKKFAPITNKYIIMHDTELDKIHGETIRSGWNAYQQSQQTGIPVDEILKGLGPALEEFLNENPHWKIEYQVSNNNGLTILSKHV